MNQITLNENAAFFQTQPSNNTSDKYQLASTKRVTDFFLDKGFYISGYSEAGTIKPDYHGKSKHVVRLRPKNQLGPDGNVLNKNYAPELVIFNSHNKYTSLKINIGVFRCICMNGLIVGDRYFQEKLTHIGDNFNTQLHEILVKAENKFPEINEELFKMSTKIPLWETKKELVTAAFNTRKTSDNQTLTIQDIMKNLEPKRLGDSGKDLYTTMNVLQEKLIRGGFQYSFKDEKSQRLKTKTFNKTKNISLQEKINKNLFNYAMGV